MSTSGSEMLFLAPFEVSPAFEHAFTLIDEYIGDPANGIVSWNLQICNLEEVFLKVASAETMERGMASSRTFSKELLEDSPKKGGTTSPSKKVENNIAAEALPVDYSDLQPSARRQIKGLLTKRYLEARRNLGRTCGVLFCPLFYILLIVLFIKILLLEAPRLELTAKENFNLDNDSTAERMQSVYTIHPAPKGTPAQTTIATIRSDSNVLPALGVLANSVEIFQETLAGETCPWDQCQLCCNKVKPHSW